MPTIPDYNFIRTAAAAFDHDVEERALARERQEAEEFALFNEPIVQRNPELNLRKAIKGSIEKLRQAAIEHGGVEQVLEEIRALEKRLILSTIHKRVKKSIDFCIVGVGK